MLRVYFGNGGGNEASILGLDVKGVELHTAARSGGEVDFLVVSNMLL